MCMIYSACIQEEQLRHHRGEVTAPEWIAGIFIFGVFVDTHLRMLTCLVIDVCVIQLNGKDPEWLCGDSQILATAKAVIDNYSVFSACYVAAYFSFLT